MSATQIKLILSIFEDNFNPVNFTDYIGIPPSNTWRKGDKIIGRKELYRKESCWEFSFGFVETLFFEDVATVFLDKFASKASQIRHYTDDNNLKTKIYLVIEIVDEEKPALFFTKDFIETVHELNAEIDFDLYIFNNNFKIDYP